MKKFLLWVFHISNPISRILGWKKLYWTLKKESWAGRISIVVGFLVMMIIITQFKHH